jgi:cytochrome c oxidase cbb3-type subunit 3
MTPPLETPTIAETQVQSELTDGPLLDHDYDGIREYDNPLPGWWRAVFWGTIAFAASYFVWVQAGWATTPDQRYRAELADYQGKRSLREAAEAASIDEQGLARNTSDDKVVARGQQIFVQRCASCHDVTGKGLIGPNLTDLYQLHGTTRFDIFQTVRHGVPGTPMPAWGEQLAPTDVVAVATYAITLRGTNVPGRPPQGLRVERWQ